MTSSWNNSLNERNLLKIWCVDNFSSVIKLNIVKWFNIYFIIIRHSHTYTRILIHTHKYNQKIYKHYQLNAKKSSILRYNTACHNNIMLRSKYGAMHLLKRRQKSVQYTVIIWLPELKWVITSSFHGICVNVAPSQIN